MEKHDAHLWATNHHDPPSQPLIQCIFDIQSVEEVGEEYNECPSFIVNQLIDD